MARMMARICATRKAPLNMWATAKPNQVRAPRVRHVGSLLFAVFVCRKFASVAAFSWHLRYAIVPSQNLET